MFTLIFTFNENLDLFFAKTWKSFWFYKINHQWSLILKLGSVVEESNEKKLYPFSRYNMIGKTMNF